MSYPNDRVYSQSHEWHKVEGDELLLGLSKFAVDQLTDVTYVEVKPVGTAFKAGESIGEVESVKTTSDVYCAAAGEIVEVNSKVVDDPSLLNSDPHGEGWLAKIKITDKAGLDKCVDAETYGRDHAN
ncbi:MAG: glycine cleavage system protein GcvH [Phycisphaerales bacterium]|nr:glycine cleavage system protein GcvH [Phycisphaerales bacterium]